MERAPTLMRITNTLFPDALIPIPLIAIAVVAFSCTPSTPREEAETQSANEAAPAFDAPRSSAYTGRTLAQLNALLDASHRLSDIEVEAYGVNPLFAAVVSTNTGPGSTPYWWLFDVTAAQVSNALAINNARLIDLEVNDSVNPPRFTVIMIPAQGMSSHWAFNLTAAGVAAHLANHHERAFHIQPYLSAGVVRYAIISLRDAKTSTWLAAATPAQITAAIGPGDRLTDLERSLQGAGTFTAIITTTSGPPPAGTWIVDAASLQISTILQGGQYRILDIESYLIGLNRRYAAIFIDAIRPGTPSLATNPASPSQVTTPTILVTTETNAQVRLHNGSGCPNPSVGTTVADGSGSASFVVVAAPNTTTIWSVEVDDAAGNTSPCATIEYVHDNIPPNAPLLGPISAATQLEGPSVPGAAEVGSVVQLYRDASCTILIPGATAISAAGEFSVEFPAATPAGMITAKATDAAGNTSACSNGIPWDPAHAYECPSLAGDLPVTRGPISYIFEGYNYFLIWADECDLMSCAPGSYFQSFLDDVIEEQPTVIGPGGFSGLSPFHWGMGPVRGVPINGSPTSAAGNAYAVYGDWTQAGPGDTLLQGFATPAELTLRMQDQEYYLDLLRDAGRPFQYVDFGTQLFGNHVNRTGFWDFYDNHWENYVAAGFDIGPKPTDPTTWLRRWVSNDLQNPAFPPELAGYSFSYSPQKPIYDPYYRYSVNILSEGWNVWWPEMIEWNALAGFDTLFVDNVYFTSCWNVECETGFIDYLENKYGTAEAQRRFTTSTSLNWDHSFDAYWTFDEATQHWSTPYHAAWYDLTMSPDLDSVLGSYSARLSGTGWLWMITLITPPPGDYRTTISYRTTPGTLLKLVINATGSTGVDVVLPPSDTWTTASFDYQVAGGDIAMHFEVDGQAWIDEVITTDVQIINGVEVTAHPQYDYGLPSSVEETWSFGGRSRTTEAVSFWDSVVDEKVTVLRDRGRQVHAGFQLFTNSYFQRRGADYFMIEGQGSELENYYQNRSHQPGTYPPGGTLRGEPVNAETVVTNVLSYKLGHAVRYSDEFAYLMHNAYLPGTTQTVDYGQNGDTALLHLAEGAAFGGGAGIDIQHHTEYWNYDGYDNWNGAPTPWELTTRAEVRAQQLAFFPWANARPYLFDCLRSYAEVAFIYRPMSLPEGQEVIQLIDWIAEQGIIFDVFGRTEISDADLARVKIVVIEQIERLSEIEAARLVAFMNAGGVVITGGKPGSLDELGRIRAAYASTVWPPVPWASAGGPVSVGSGIFWMEPGTEGLTTTSLSLALQATLRPSLSAFEPADSKLRIAVWTAYDRTIVHVLNYGAPRGRQSGGQVALRTLEVRVALPPGQTFTEAVLSSPEHGDLLVPLVMLADGRASFTIPAFHVYTVAQLR